MHIKIAVPMREGSQYGHLKPSSGGHVEQSSSYGVFIRQEVGETNKERSERRGGEEGANRCEKLGQMILK